MSKGLEAYKIVKEECSYAFGGTANGDRVRENLPIIEKELKAFEIIKNKRVDTTLIQDSEDLEYYNLDVPNYYVNYEDMYLTQEEYDLLKEVLL